MRLAAFILPLTVLIVIISGCGGGGGGGDGGNFSAAADVSISDSPSEIDGGDRTQVTIQISNLNPAGITLKVRFPDGLEYVPGSSFLAVGDQRIDITPAVITRKDSKRYLVYFFSASSFGEDNSGELQIELVGVTSVPKGVIEVDPDVDNPLVPNSDEFNPSNPSFTAEASVDIVVHT